MEKGLRPRIKAISVLEEYDMIYSRISKESPQLSPEDIHNSVNSILKNQYSQYDYAN